MKKIILFITLSLTLSGCLNKKEKDFEKASSVINQKDFARNLITLSSDAYQGRKPMTRGEDSTVKYIKAQFEKLKLEPAFGNNYYQNVPLVNIFSTPSDMTINARMGKIVFKNGNDFVAFTERITDKVGVENATLVFAGYGIVAPEYNWNDYDGLDVKGKVVVVLVNDPGFATGDITLFKGKTMTYYGRWTYKYEEAARQGAAGCIIIHEDAAASYPWSVVASSNGSSMHLQDKNKHVDTCGLEAWMTMAAAQSLFAGCGRDYLSDKRKACIRGFKPFEMGATVSLTLNNKLRFGVSKNVGAILRGTDRKDECVIYSAHWDHLGIGKPINGDSIYNGAADNASGVAAILEIAKAYSTLKTTPNRSVLFLAFTAEESGLLGSQYYVKNPSFPLSKTVADINFDIMTFWGRMKDVTLISYGESELDKSVAKAAKKQNRYVIQDPFPEHGSFFRADHFWFARVGVPVVYGSGFYDHRQKGKAFARKKLIEYTTLHYHRPSDEYNPKIHDLSGAIEDTKLFFNVGYVLTNEAVFPKWYDNSPWKKIREMSNSR
jgi:Zn-dependent M28 family amino/carboxypeptidase